MNGPTIPHAHGGNIIRVAAELGCRPTDLVDMSSNLSPLGPPAPLLDHLCRHIGEVGHLPEADSRSLRERFARQHHLDWQQVLAGSGTTEFIFALPQACRVQRAIIPQPTYGDYALACRQAGLPVEEVAASASLEQPLERISRQLTGGELVFFCNPNNPTGKLVSTATLRQWITAHPQTLFVIDESYLPFCDEPSLLHRGIPENCLLLCSYSKIFAIAGLRLGFLVGPAPILDRIHQSARPWGVNRLAQLAGEHLTEHGQSYRQQVLAFLAAERPRVVAALSSLPLLEVVPGAMHYILCHLTGGHTAEDLARHCLAAGILIRNCANFTGLDNRYFRISLKTPEANDRFTTLLHGYLSQGCHR